MSVKACNCGAQPLVICGAQTNTTIHKLYCESYQKPGSPEEELAARILDLEVENASLKKTNSEMADRLLKVKDIARIALHNIRAV